MNKRKGQLWITIFCEKFFKLIKRTLDFTYNSLSSNLYVSELCVIGYSLALDYLNEYRLRVVE